MSRIKTIFKNPIFKLGFLIIFLILFFGYVRHAFFVRASDERINIYPQAVSREDNSLDLEAFVPPAGSSWQDGERAFSAEADPIADFSVFSKETSAYISFGSGQYESNAELVSTSTSNNPAAEESAGSSTDSVIKENLEGDKVNSGEVDPKIPEEAVEQSTSTEETSGSNSSSVSPENEIVPETSSDVQIDVPSNTLTDGQSDALLNVPSAGDDLSGSETISSEVINHLPQAAPAEVSPAVLENSETQSASSEETEIAPSPVVPDNVPAVENSGSNSAEPTQTPLSFLDNLRIAKQGIGLLWKNLTVAQNVLAEEEIGTSSPADLGSTSLPAPLAPEYEDSLIFSNFDLGGYSSESEIVNVQLRLSLAAKSSFNFDHLQIEYSVGEEWQAAGNLFLKGSISNSVNGGYFLYALPLSLTWDDIDNLKVKVSYLNSEIGENDLTTKGAKVYLDGIWLEVDYSNGKVKGEKDLNDLDREKVPGEEKHFFGDEPLVVNGQEINFPYTDENSNESLLIKSDRQDYSGLTAADVYLSVTNRGEEVENFGLQSYFSGEAGNLASLEKLNRKYTAAEEPILGTRVYSCAEAWQQSATSSEKYFCPDKNITKECNSFSRDGKKCRQEKAIIGLASAVGQTDEWKNADVKRGRLDDKRNFVEKLLGAGPKKKSVPKTFIPRESTAAETYPIEPGETQYFRMKINFVPGSKGEFYVETIGDKSGYGLLDPWWNASWDYERPITVSYSGTSALTDFQVSVTVDTAALIAAGKMKSDCSDIRFADTNKYNLNSELSYYLEPGSCNKTYTRLWVKIPSITGNKTIYMYYGNSSASSVSSGANTFVYFNDFETSVDFNAGLLSPTRTGKSAKNGSFGLNGNGYSSLYLATRNGISSGRNLIWESWLKGESSSTVSSLAGVVVGHPNGNTGSGYQAIIDTRGGANHYLSIRKDYDAGQTLAYSDTTTVANNTWYFMQLSWRSTNVIWASLYAGATTTSPLLTCSTTDSSYTNGEYGVAAYQIGDWDNYRIRKYASSTVSSSLGSETIIVNHAPTNPSSMTQYSQSTSSVMSNGSWTNQRQINLYATSTDKDLNSVYVYYQLATTSGSFATATSVPNNACQTATAYTSCSNRIWTNMDSGNWYNIEYKYRVPVTILASRVAGSLTDFPVYLDLARLGTSNSFWSHTKKNSDGGDLIMTTADGKTRVPIEVVSISTSTKTGELYFKAPSISSSSDITFYLYYGSSTAAQPASSTATYGSQQVWSNGYVSVYHLNANANDSKGNNRGTVTNAVSSASAKVGGYSYYFDGDTDYITLANEANFDFTGAMSVEAWVNSSGFTDDWQAIVAKADTAWRLARNLNTNYPELGRSITGTTVDVGGVTISINNTGWHHVVGTFDNTNSRIFTDSSNENTINNTAATLTNNAAVTIGRNSDFTARDWYGYIDEVRIANTAFTRKWVSTEYNNQSNPSTFFSTSSEENIPARTTIKIPSVSDGNYKWQAMSCDAIGLCSNWISFDPTTPNFSVDATAPVFSNTLSSLASTTVSIKLGFPSTVTETNFKQYKIYYRVGSSTAPNESDTLLSSSTDANLGVKNFNGKSSTTISNLATSTWYSFVIFAYDQAGNKASSSYIVERTDRAPTVSFNSVSQKRDGTGAVNFSVAVNDADQESQMLARVEYYTNSNCRGTALKATLDETDANTFATYGDPKVQNKNAYQIGTTTGWILTSSGPNTIYFNWLSKIDFGIATGTVCFKLNLDDGRGGYRIATTSLFVDNVSPTKPGSLTYSKRTGASVTLFFGAPAHDNLFREYKIYYKAAASGVRETDFVFSSSSDINLWSVVYGGAATTTISGLAPDTQYVFNIWAYDYGGNKASATTEVIVTTKSVPAIASSLGQYFFDGVTAIGNNTWTDQSEVNLYATSTGSSGNPITIYYNFDISANPYLTSTSTPVSACSSGTSYSSCPGKIWYASKANQANIKNIPDGSYRWQALACDADGCARSWKTFNATIPNIKIDLTAPELPGRLTYNSKGTNYVKLNFGSLSSDYNFNEYRIYYKQGTSGVKETNLLWGSSSDASLGYVNLNGKSSTTITGLTNGASYVFNIFAYDIFGHRSSSSVETVVNLGNGPAAAFAMEQYKFGMNPVSNTGWISSSTIILSATSSNDLPFLTYYELIGNGSTFTSATTTPRNVCPIGTSFNSCGTKIWVNGASTSDWYDADFRYRTKITILASSVTGALSNFPVYFDLARLGTSNSFWSHTRKNSSGGDLLMTNSDGTTRIPIEVMSVSTSTKTGEIYFKAASISSSSNVSFYLYYGSSTASQPASSTATIGSQNVWDSGFKGVFHYGATSRDSTSNSSRPITDTSVTNTSIAAVGYSSAGFTTAGSNAITYSATGPMNIYGNTPITVETWIRYTALAAAFQQYFNKGDLQYAWQKTNANPGVNQFCIYDGGWKCVANNSTVSTGNWYYTVGTYIGTNGGLVNTYENGVLQTANNTATTITQQTGDAVAAGGYTGRFTDGYIDEVRVSNVRRSSKWISTTYNNEKTPSSFFSTSTEDLYPALPQKNVRISGMPDSATGYKWQVISCDFYGCSRNWTKFNLTTPNFKVDTVAPAFSNTFTGLASTTISLKLAYPSAATESNFSQYKLFYQTGSTTPVHENATWSVSSSTSGYSYLSALNFNGKSSTTFENLATGTVYSFSLWAYDQAGNKASTTLFWDRTDRAPNTVVFNSAAQRVDGSGRFDVSFNVNDLDGDNQLMARMDYTAGTVCNSGTLSKATLDEVDANASAVFGDPKVQNKNYYQIGTSTGYILTSSGPNTVSFDWLSKSDLPSTEGVYCLRLTVNDNKGGTKIATTSVYVDNAAPTPPGSLTIDSFSGSSLVANFGAASTETNFRQYKIFYKAGSSGVRETDLMFGSSSDSALASITYLSHGSTTINGLNGNTQYVFNIWAYDIYGNKASATTEMLATTKNIPAVASSLDQYLLDGTTVIANNTWIPQNEINLYATSTDSDGNAITIYYQLATSTGQFITSTSTPINACATGVSYSSCPGRVWYSSKSVKADLKAIPDGLYKWQALACTVNGCARNWNQFNATIPNVMIDATAPTLPGPLTFNIKGATTAKFSFGAPTSDVYFDEYKIFYKQGMSGVKETDLLWSSTSASMLGFINYNGKSSTTVTGLTNGVSYVFNIFAYDKFGRRSSSSVEVVVNLGNGPAAPFGLQQYKFGMSQLDNGGWIGSSSIILAATSTGDLPFFMFYELISNGSSFTSATTTLHNVCQPGTSYNSCASKIWANGTTSPNWFDTDYLYRAKITVKSSQVSNVQTNFPVYFDLARLGTSNSFWSHTRKNSSGGDLIVTNSAGTRLPLEVVSVSTSTKTGEIYFRADSLSYLANSDFYIYYGSSTASQPASTTTYGSQNVWSNGYKGVWHLNESAGSTRIKDSTSYANSSSTLSGTVTLNSAGKLGKSANFDGASRIMVERSANLEPVRLVTFSVWMNGDATQNTWAKPIWYGHNAVDPYGTYGFEYNNTSDTDVLTAVTSATTRYTTTGYTTVSNTWNYLTGVNDGASIKLYVNGSQRSTASSTATLGFYDTVNGLGIGNRFESDQGFAGYIDEVRIASSSRSAEWVNTEYNNQSNPSAFFSTTTEEAYQVTRSRTVKISSMPDSSTGYKWQAIACDATGCSRNWTKFNLTTPNFRVDTAAPTSPGQLAFVSRNTNSITLSFGAPTTEANFRQYKIFYKAGTSGVKETDILYGSSTDPGLGFINYNNETTFTIGGLNPNTQYAFNIWAYDQVGNKASSTSVSFQTSNALTQTYVYTNGSSNGWTDPTFAWDVTDDTYAYRSIPGNSVNDSSSYLQGTANNIGVLGLSILGVELGLEGYSIDPSRINYKIIPIFNGLTPGATTTISGSLFGRVDGDNSFYSDITNDPQAPATWTWNDLMNLDAKLYAANSSTSAATAYVDQIRLRVSVDAYPENASNLQQYQSDETTVIANNAWLKQTSLILKAEATDPDASESLSLYFQFATTSGTFISSTTKPLNACANGTSYAGCSSKVWVAAYSGAPANFSVTPFVGTSSITGIPDGSYKWQVLACDMNNICSSWVSFNASVPNVNIDNTAPTVPGNLTFNSKTSGSVTVNFGGQTTETNFYRYRIFYRKSSTTPVTELDYEQSDSNLNFKNYNGAATTTIAGLAKLSWYTFDIWAYDLAGNKASATVPLIVKTNDGYSVQQTSYLIENDDGAGVNLNTAPGLAGVPLNNVERGQRLNARFQIQNTGADQTYNKRFKIQYENNTDAPNYWYDVGLNTDISFSYGLSGTNGDAITAVKGAANGNTWANGTWHEYTNLTNMYNLAVNNYTEFVFAVQTANAVAGKTYRLRLIDGTGSSTFSTYSAYPTVSIVANDTKKYSKANVASLPSNSADLAYFLDNPGYTALGSDDANRDSLVSSAGQYPIYNFAVKYSNAAYNWNVSWNGQSSAAPSSNNIVLQVFRFGSTNAWTTINTNNSAAANTDFSLAGLVDYHISEYASGGYSYWRIYQAPGAETLRSDYFVFSTTTLTPYVTGRHYRWRNDDAPYGTWREVMDTPDPTLGTVIQKNNDIRLRLSFTNTKAGNASNYAFGLQYATTTTNCSSGSLGPWTPVRSTATSTLHFQMASSIQFNNASSTSSQLSSDGYTYISGSMIEGPYSTSSALTLLEDRYTEMEFNFKATANAKDGQTYCFRGTNNGTALDAYDRYAELSVGNTSNSAPAFTSMPSDTGSATNTPTVYGQNVTFQATSTDAEGNEYYLAICQTNSILPGNGGAPTCSGGSWCISALASSTAGAVCTYNTNHQFSESLTWYAFVCDLRYGAGVSKCSAASQGTVGSPNASPFRVNHPPAYASVSTLNDFLNPGSTFNIQAMVSDSDTNNTLNYYVCRANSASSTGCNGGSGNTVCQVVATSSPNPICHYQNTAPSPAGAFTYYAFVYDNFGLGATTSPRSSTYNINNVAPVIGTPTLNNGNDITLNIKGAADRQVLMVNTSVTDQNGCQSLVSATGVIYRSGVGFNCAANDNNCYQINTAHCLISDCSGSTDAIATYTCSTSLKFFAEPTDNATNNPWAADNWVGRFQVYDGSNYAATSTNPVEVKTNIALDVPQAIINFGSMNPGDDTGTTNQSTNVVNYGNSPINNNLAGSDMAGVYGGTIASTFIHWDLTESFNYPVGNTLKNGGEVVTLNLAKPTSVADVAKLIYWGIGVPGGSNRTTYKGTSTFAAVLDSASW